MFIYRHEGFYLHYHFSTDLKIEFETEKTKDPYKSQRRKASVCKASTMKVGTASTGDTMFMTKKAPKYSWFGAPLIYAVLQVMFKSDGGMPTTIGPLVVSPLLASTKHLINGWNLLDHYVTHTKILCCDYFCGCMQYFC